MKVLYAPQKQQTYSKTNKAIKMARNYTEYTAAIEQVNCAITGIPFEAGDRIVKYDLKEYTAVLDTTGLPHDVAKLSVEQTDYSSSNIGKWILADYIITKKRTRSGRAVKPVMRQDLLDHVKGSGIVGCDTYDRSFDRGLDTSWQAGRGADSVYLNQNLNGFVVDDKEEVKVDDNDEEEKEWSDEEDTDEEEDEWEESDEEDVSEDEDEESEAEDEDGYCHGCESGVDSIHAHTDACNHERGFM